MAEYAGYGIIALGNVFVKDNAEIKTTATDVALSVVGALEISGGTVTAESKGQQRYLRRRRDHHHERR